MKCLSMKRSYLWNVLSMKCPIYEMSYLWNVLSMKSPIYEMSFYIISFYEIFFYEISFYEISFHEISYYEVSLYEISFNEISSYEISFYEIFFFVIFSYEMSQRPFINPFINKMVWKHLFWQTNIFKERGGWVLLTTYKHIASIFTKNLNLNAIINCKVQNKTYIFLNKIDLNLHNCTKWIKNNNAWNKLLRLNLNLFICRLFHSYFFIREILNFINLWIQ